MSEPMSASGALDAKELSAKSPEEKLLEAIFGPRPLQGHSRNSQTITPETADAEFGIILKSLDRSETRLRLLQNQMWRNRREIDAGLERIRSFNDRIEANLKLLASNG
jgi:hypothetical protein